MIKYLALFLTFCIYVLASPIEGVWIAPDKQGYSHENIKEISQFQEISLPIKLFDTQDYWIRVKVNDAYLNRSNAYLLKIETEFGRDNLEYSSQYDNDLIDKEAFYLNRSDRQYYYFKLKNKTNTILFNAEVIEEAVFRTNNMIRTTFYGVSYGIMMSAVLYYLAFFIFNREKTHLYYAITQLFMLATLLTVTSGESNENEYTIFVFFYAGFILATSLFLSSFLQLKRFAPVWEKIMYGSGVILIIEAFTNFFTLLYIPTAELMLIYIVVAIIVYYKTSLNYILFYLLGWGILISSFIFLELQLMFFGSYITSPGDVLHTVMPLESLILAYALSYKMKLMENEKTTKERMLIHYDKRASIGDMVDNIAHQWRQPLTHIGYLIMNVSAAVKNDRFTQKFWENKESEMTMQLEYMSKTIDDFRNFYNPTTNTSSFNLYECVDKTFQMVKSTLTLNEIELVLIGSKDIVISGNENELSQVTLNFINNAQEAFERHAVKDKKITITISQDTISIEDNAGGIDAEIKDRLFEPYVSSKEKGGGLGLYMSKLIIEEHFNATIHHDNTSQGSLFWMTFTK